MPDKKLSKANVDAAKMLYHVFGQKQLEYLIALKQVELRQSIRLALRASKRGPEVFPRTKHESDVVHAYR